MVICMSTTYLFQEFQADLEKQLKKNKKIKANIFNVPLNIHQKFSLRQD